MSYPIYLVSLARDEARRQALAARFPQHASEFQLVEAVDGRAMPARAFFERTVDFYRNYRRLMSPAELGCTLSHLQVYETFLQSAAERALVLEDDVEGDDAALAQVLALAVQLPQDAILIAGGQQGLVSRKRLYGKPTTTPGLYELADYSYPHIKRTCGYVLARQSAALLLQRGQATTLVADGWDRYVAGTGIRLYYAPLLSHPELLAGSHIERDRLDLDPGFWQKVFSPRLPRKLRQYLQDICFQATRTLHGYRRLP
ncbi:MAG TPA: glycosyltransferase family 25 protein [Chitinolyticbacter sp.]|nr:glycosyltransferase family 25 protein [Chitinolyticbacter sp.]